ncbi:MULTISPECIES: hypothetical protein [unclassified Leucobacter]|uniref:hypothetical protein n=1 Tax=unclassified Leucobacter TaxID=2621730 RepID=UPI00203D4AA8|nr:MULTISPECIES: hypothetical protein [unclassified Leucobacter]
MVVQVAAHVRYCLAVLPLLGNKCQRLRETNGQPVPQRTVQPILTTVFESHKQVTHDPRVLAA